MSKVNLKDNTITWDYEDWLEGLNQQNSIAYPFIGGGLNAATSFNPLRNLGFAAPGELPVNCTNSSAVTTALVGLEYSAITGYGYGAGGALIHQITISTKTITNTGGTYPYTVTGATISDYKKYTISGADYMFYSYNTSSSANVGRHKLSDNTFDDDYFSAVAGGSTLNKDKSHPMIVGDDDVLYIGNGNILACLDGAVATDNVLQLPNQFEIKSFAKFDNNTLIIFASSGSEVKAFFWDYLSLDPYKALSVDGRICGAGFEYQGTIGCFTEGLSADPGSNTRNIGLFLYDGEKFKKIYYFIGGNAPIHNGVEVLGDVIYANILGNIYTFGSPFDGVVCKIQKIVAGAGTTLGAIKSLSSGVQFFSTGNATFGGLQYLNGRYVATASAETAYTNIKFPYGKMGKIKNIRVELGYQIDAGDEGRTLDVYLLNQADGVIMQTSSITTVDSSLIYEQEFDYDNSFMNYNFNMIKCKLDWTAGSDSDVAPIVKRVIATFDLINN